MKKILIGIISLLTIFATSVFASPVYAGLSKTDLAAVVPEEIDYAGKLIENYKGQEGYEQYLTLWEGYQKTLKAFDKDLFEKKHNDAKVTLYVFRGSTCSHCLDLMTFLAKSYPEIADYADVQTYEVWGNQDNSSLMNVLAEYFQIDSTKLGVPFIVIGDKHFEGYASAMDTELLSTIKAYAENLDSYTDYVALGVEGNLPKPKANTLLTVIVLLVAGIAIVGIILSRKNVTYYDDNNDTEPEENVKEVVKASEKKVVEKKPTAKKTTAKKTTNKSGKKTAKKTK